MTTLLKFNAAPLQEFQSVLLHASFIKSQLTLHAAADFVPFEADFFRVMKVHL